MSGHYIELLGYLPALNCDRLPLLAERRRARHQRPQFLFQTINRFDRAIYKPRDRDHRSGDHDKRDRDDPGDDNQPEQWIVSAHSSKNTVLCTWYLVLCFRRFKGPVNSTRQSTKIKALSSSFLHCLLRLVSRRGFSAAGKFSLALLFDVSLFARFHCGLD